jgi:hypothetical protein
VPGATACPAGREPAWYAIRVAGALPAAPDARLEGFRLTTASTGDLTTTELVGEVPDQGALIRMLRALHEQGLALLDLVRLPTPEEPGVAGPRRTRRLPARPSGATRTGQCEVPRS